jgi:acetyl esterase/lipase
LQDAQRAISILRARAAEWHVDPHKIGVMGFSAGGHLVAHVSTQLVRSYPRIDAIDDQPSRPDFAIPLYPGHLWIDESKLELHPHIHVTDKTPPTLIVQATDDDVDDVNNSLVYYRALVAAHVPVEMHLFAHGGHAFGLRKPTEPVGAWPRLVETWLASLKMIPDQSTSSARNAK